LDTGGRRGVEGGIEDGIEGGIEERIEGGIGGRVEGRIEGGGSMEGLGDRGWGMAQGVQSTDFRFLKSKGETGTGK
jgi:hypothetical protein